MKILKTFVCIAAVFAMAASAQADELAGNLGFEDPMGPVNGDASTEQNWFGFTGPGSVGVGTNTIDPLSGANHAELVIADNTTNSFVGIQQWIDAEEGENYDFSFFAKNDGGTYDVGNEFRIEWIDSGGAEISRIQLTDAFTNTYSSYTVGGVAPAGTVQLRAVIALQSFNGGAGNGVARIDDTSVQGPAVAVPEPTSLAVISLGLLGFVTRRRR